MNSHKQLFGVDQIPTFTQFALEILATRTKEELSKLRDKLNGIAQSSAKIPRSNPFNATLIHISNFYTMLYRAKHHMLGKSLDESEVKETSRLINSLYALMNAGWMKDSEAGAVVYLVNSYISLGTCAVSCAMQASLNISDDAIVDCVTSFVTGCVYDQANSEEIVKSAQQNIGFDYQEFSRGFHVIDNDNEPKSACEKLIYEFNRMIVDALLKMRFKVRSSPHHLTRINALMMQMNLWQLDELRASFTEDQSRFTLSLDNLEPHNLQALYVPSVCGLAGRIDSENKLDSLKSYLTKSHQMILQLYQMSLIDKDHLPLNSKMIASTIKEMLTSMFLDYRILRAHMIRLKKSNLDNLDVRIQQNDLILIHSELSGDIGPLVGQDYDEQFEKSYLVTRSGMHANLKPVCVRLFNKANDNEFISRKLIEEFERLFRKHQSWQDKDGSSEDKSRFARFIKDYFVACLRNVKTDSELKRLKAILTSGKIEQLESDPECDKIYDALLILLSGRTAPIPRENIRLYLSEFAQISPKLEHASRTMSVMNFSLFFTLARQMTNTILDDKTGELAQYKQEAESCDIYLNKFREAADQEVKALITAINSPNKKYNPAAAITSPNDTKATLKDYLDLAARVMRAESEEQLSALADEIDKIPAHPLLLLDGAYACNQLSYDRCTTHLHDLLNILFITRKISLQLPVTPAALSSLMKSQAALKLVSVTEVGDRFPTCVLKLYFKLAAHLVEIFINTNSAELANLCIDFLNEIRIEIQYLSTSTPISTKTYTASILEQISLCTVTILSDDHGKHSNEQFIAALQSMMLCGLAQARTRSYTECEQHRKHLASANKKQLDVAQYHESFLSVSIFDNVIARMDSSDKAAAIQAESALVRAIEVFAGANTTIEKVISLAKMPVGPSLAAFRDGSGSKTQLALEIMTRLASLHNTLCRSFHVTSNDVMNKKRADIVCNANIYNDYIMCQLTFLESDLRHLSDSAKDLSRELVLVRMLKQFIQVCYYDIKRSIPNNLLIDILNFNFDDIIFDRYFNEDMSKMIVSIIDKQFDYYATNPEQLKSNLNMIQRNIARLIERYDKTNGEIKKYAARLIMEYYLPFVYLSAITKSTKQAESLHEKVFALCKGDELLPTYRFIYLGYQKRAGFAGEIVKKDVNELFTALCEVSEIKPGVMDDVLNGLSPVLYAYLSGLSQKVTVGKLRLNKSLKQPHNHLALLLQKFANEPQEIAIIQEFIVNVSAVNDTQHSALEHAAAHEGTPVTVADFIALAAEILAIQNAEQAAPIARKVDEITVKPFIIQLEGEWKHLQDAVNATSTNLSSMLLMLYVARKQALNLPIPAMTLERQQRIIPQLLNTPTDRSGQSVFIYLVNMIILQTARVSQYFGTPDHQVDVHEIDCVLSLPRKIRREVSRESFLFPGTATHRLCEEMHGSFDAFLQPTTSNSATHVLMQKLSGMMRSRLAVIRKSLEARTNIARNVLSTQEMTLPQRDKMYACAVQLSLLDVVLVELRPSEHPEESAHYARFRAAHPLPSIAHSVDSKELDTKTMPPFLALLISRDTLTNSLDDITKVCLRYFSLLNDVFKSRYTLCIELVDATKPLDSLIVRELKRCLKDLSLIIESARYVQQSDKAYHERLDILHCIRGIVDIYISYIENGANALTLKKINTFDYIADITFDTNFTSSIANALEFILSLRLSAQDVDRANTGIKYGIIKCHLNDLDTFIAKLKDCTCNKQDAARFIMECYLLICKQALLFRHFDAAEKYHDRFFALINNNDPLLPIYTSIYQYLLYVTQTLSTDIPRPEFSDSFFKMFSGAESDTIETLNLMQRLPNSLVDLLFKMLWTHQGNTELVNKKQANHQVARYGIYANTISSSQLISLTEPVVAPAAPVVNVTIETEKVEITKAVPVKAALPRAEPAQAEPPKASPPALCEADVNFEVACKQFDGVHSDKCFDGIYKLFYEALNGKQHNKAIRAKAAIGLAQALLHRIDETENLKRRESIYKTLQMYDGFINKIDSQMAKTFKQHMKLFGNHLEKLAKKVEVPQSVSVAEVTELAEVSGDAEVTEAVVIAEVAEVTGIAEIAEAASQPDTTVPVQPPPPAIVTEHVEFKKRKLTSADVQFETVCKFCHADDADVCFDQIAKYCNEALSSAKNTAPIRITAALTLARALLYRIDEAATITKRQNAFTTLQGYQTFVVKNMQKVSKELSDYLIAFEAHLVQQVRQAELVRPEEIAQPVTAAEQPIVAAEPSKETAQPKETPTQKKTESSTPARTNLTVFAPAKLAITQQAKNKKVEVKAILKRTPPTSDLPVPSTSTSAVMQRLEAIEPVDDSLLPCRVQPTNRLLDNFAPQLTPCKSKLLNVFLGRNKNVFLYGNAVLSPLFNNKSGHLQLVCRMPKDRLFKFLTDDANHEFPYLQEILALPRSAGYLIRLDEKKLQAAKETYDRTDLLIEVRCVSGANNQAALKRFCHEERLTSMLFYDVGNRCLIDTCNHAKYTAVYPVMLIDQRDNISGNLDLMPANPEFPQSTRDNREVILEALLQLSTHHLYLGCGMKLKQFIADYKPEFYTSKKTQFPIEWLDELFLNHNAWDTARWLDNFDMLYELFPQLDPDYAQDFFTACEQADAASHTKHYSSLSYHEILSQRAGFLLTAFFRSFKQSIKVLDYLVEDGLAAFMETFCRFLRGLLFECFRLDHTKQDIANMDLLELLTQNCWDLIMRDAIPAIYQEFRLSHPDVFYKLEDKEQFIHDLVDSLASNGYPNRLWLAQQVWAHHEFLGHQPLRVAFM
jgi:hypothetical protein